MNTKAPDATASQVRKSPSQSPGLQVTTTRARRMSAK
jgi:hypothetical protein